VPDWNTVLTSLSTVFTGVVAILLIVDKWVSREHTIKEKDATIEALKQFNENLRLNDVKVVNDRYIAVTQQLAEVSATLNSVSPDLFNMAWTMQWLRDHREELRLMELDKPREKDGSTIQWRSWGKIDPLY
jgi:hypothetical protein